MTNSTKKQSASKAPTHIAFQVSEGRESQNYWNRIGCAWPHADGLGFNIHLESLPVNGRITLRVPSEE